MNVQLRGGMNPLFHCKCKRAVLSSADGVCINCEKGIPYDPPRIPEKPRAVNWQILRAKGITKW